MVNEMARRCRVQESLRRYLKGLEDKKRLAKRKSGNLFDPAVFEPRAISRCNDRRKDEKMLKVWEGGGRNLHSSQAGETTMALTRRIFFLFEHWIFIKKSKMLLNYRYLVNLAFDY
jgi:hypothetical protein